MTPERWQQVKKIFQSALERDPGERAAYLNQACASDPGLRRDVDSLISSHDQSGDSFETVAINVAAQMLADGQASAILGQQIGPYKVMGHIGRGGMGEVYLAQDSRLARKVALKLLPSHITHDGQRLERFKREARAASALNHPNILTIYEIGETEGRPFIATELIEGETLRSRIDGSPIEPGQALDVAIQVASGLNAAHEAGIVHRDVKPENIMLRCDGLIKVLDFGLAKLVEKRAAGHEISTLVETDEGVIMGTTRYMSPEQARGQVVDARTDLWSLGVVLYEMLSGRAPFEGATAGDVIVSILEREPAPLVRYGVDVPPELDWIVKKGLRKERDERYQTAKELLSDLKGIKQRLEFKAELERSAQPAASGNQPARIVGQSTAERTNTAAVETGKVESAHPISSAKYIVTEIERHRTAALTLAILLITAAAFILFSHRSLTPTFRSIAVLPFKSLGGTDDYEYLKLGMADALITRLSNLRQIAVRPTSAVLKYSTSDQNPVAAGVELNVDSVLEGSVQRSGDKIRVTVQLVSVRDGTSLWAGKFDEEFTGLFGVQDSISERLVDALALKLTSEQKEQLTKQYTHNSEAYNHYLKGRFHFAKRTDEALKKSVEHFNQALIIDPEYALAYAGLSDSYIYLHDSALNRASAEEAYVKAKAAATKALELDPTLAEAHSSLALVKMEYDWDLPGAEAEFERALELNPNSAETHHEYSHYLVIVGRIEESFTESLRALDLDPLSLPYNGHLAWHYYHARAYDQAIAACKKTLELDPNYRPAYEFLGNAYAQKGMYEDAVTSLQKAVSLSEGSTQIMSYLAYAYALAGKRKEALNIIGQLTELSKQRYVSPVDMAIIYIGLEEKERALDLLEKAYAETDRLPSYLKTSPMFDGLRSEERFKALLRRVGLSD